MIQLINNTWFQENMATAKECKEYKKGRDVYLFTSRFNDETYAENRKFCTKYKKKCLYSNPHPLPPSVPADAIVYVIEMNNTKDKIVGIGKVQNRMKYSIFNIYGEEFYNQNHFEGVDHISADQFDEKYKPFMESLEQQCFFGRGHLKRGHRMLSFPDRKLGTCMKNGCDIIGYIEGLFKKKPEEDESEEETVIEVDNTVYSNEPYDDDESDESSL